MLFLLLSLIVAKEYQLNNNHLTYTWTVDDKNSISTKEIVNKNTDTPLTITPAHGSEEFVISLPIDHPDEYPNPLDKSSWTITSNSEHSAQGNEGPAKNLLDNNIDTIWHSYYTPIGPGGHDDRKEGEPFRFTVNTGKLVKFHSISYTHRKGGGNGVFKDFKLYAGKTNDELEENIKKDNPILDDIFEVNHDGKCYVNIEQEVEAQYIALLTDGDGTYASGAEFDLYDGPVPASNYFIKASELQVQKTEQPDDSKIVFTFQPYVLNDVTWDIRETVELQADKHYLHKYFEIKSSKPDVVIDYIDLVHFVISKDDLQYSWGSPMVENVFKNLGQPVYINTLFFGSRFPLTHSLIEKYLGRVRYYTGKKFSDFELNSEGYYQTWQTVVGVARSNIMAVVRNDFFSYIADIAVASPFRKQYNSWYDWMLRIDEQNIMQSFKEIERGCSQYGLPPFDSYVVDDGWNNYNTEKYGVYDVGTSGTTYNTEGFWTFNDKFPQKFTPPSEWTRKICSNFGVWLGPRGGYVTPGQFGKMIEDAGNGFYSEVTNDIDVASHKYIKKVKELLISFIHDYKVNYYKLDGFSGGACKNATHDHMVGGAHDLYYYTDLYENYIAAYIEMIDAAKKEGLDNFWISSTTYTNLSPFHLQWSNSVWIQISSDMGETLVGGNDNECDQMLTYRDQCYWSFYDERQYQFPAKNLYNHDPIYGQAGTVLRGSMDDDYFRTFLYGCAMRGTAFYELYYTYDMIDEGDKWYVNSDVLSWAEKNFHILQHSQRFGGKPAQGQVYGYSAWDGSDGIVALRNPGGEETKFSLKLDRDVGVTEGIPTVYRSTRLHHRTTNTDEIKNGVPYKYGDTLEVTLQQGEYRIYEFHSEVDKDSPVIEVLKSTKFNEVLIRFNKYVDLSESRFDIEGLEVEEVNLRGDLRTVTLTTTTMTNYTTYDMKISKVKDIFGNSLDTTVKYQFFENNEIISMRGEVKGTDEVVFPGSYETDSFTINVNVKEFGDFKSGVLLHSEDNSIVVEVDSDGHLKFTVGKVSVISNTIVHNVGSQHYTFVRERNTMLKIYVNSEIDNSAYIKDAEALVKIEKIIMNKNSIIYTYMIFYNYGVAYSEIPFEITLKNEYIERVFAIENHKVRTKQITNFRTDNIESFMPEKGSEEWTFALPISENDDGTKPIDRSEWTVTANSEQTTNKGQEGAAVNMIDGNINTIWHSRYNDKGQGGHDDRISDSDPFQVTFNFNKIISYKAFSYTPRQNGPNGIIKHYQIYVGDTAEELQNNIDNKKYVSDGTFKYFHTYPVYVNFDKEIKSQYLALLSLEHGGMGSGADFSLYSEFVKDPYLEVKSSDCDVEYEYQRNSEDVQKLIFTFQYKYFETTFNITETYELMSDKPYIEKQVEIQCSDEKQKIYFIDMESFLLNEETESSSWTHPIREQDVDSGLTPFVINLGQPVYIKSFFTGCRFPLNDNAIEEHVAHLRYHSGKTFGQLLADSPHQEDQDENTYYCWKTVIGAARSSRLEVVRNDLFSYISEISVPTSFRKQYNSWYDWMLKINESNILESFKEIERGCSQYGVPPLDSYVVDDGWNNYNTDKYGVYDEGTSGTTYNTEGFWVFNTKFPEGLKNPSDFAHRISSRFGVWLGPRGGYVTPGQFGKVIEDAGKGYYNAQAGDIDVGSHRYIENLDKFLSNWISEYKINYFKLDGFASAACTNKTHDHMVGGPNDAYYYTDLWERYIHVFEHFREVASENEIPNFWISITCFVNPSPFHLQWANSVWFQISGDVGYIDIGGNHNYADQMLTYRDSCYYNFSDYLQFQFPAKNLYNHDPIYGKAGTSLKGSMDDDDFRSFLYGCSMRGNAFVELYYTYDMIDEGDKWYVNSDVLSWAEKNFHILQHSQRFGGKPAQGQVYGYSAWDGSDGIVALRNPGGEETKFSLKLDRDVGVTEGIPTVYRSTRLHHRTTNTDEIKNGVPYKYGDTLEVTLQQGEYRIYEFHSEVDKDSPVIEVLKSTKFNEVLIRFNKYVDLSESRFDIEGLEVEEVNLRGDLRTVTLTTTTMTNYTTYDMKISKVKDIFGNSLDTTVKYQFFENNEIISMRGEVKGTDEVVFPGSYETDSFTINVNVKEFGDFKSGVLLHSEDNSIVVEVDSDGHLKFTVGKVSVISNTIVHNVGSQHYTFVRERNTMLKIYVNSEIDNSAYIKDAEALVKIEKIIMNKNSIIYTYMIFYNYGVAYSEIPFEITLKNEYIERVFAIENHKVRTKQITNFRTDNIESFMPEKGSEEWTFALPISENDDGTKPIDRSEWTVTANSEQTTNKGQEGAAVNMIDGNINTIWHSRYNDKGQGGHDDRISDSDPFQVTFNFNKIISYKAFSYTPRQNGPNGIIKHYQIYVGDTAEELQNNIDNKKYVSDGTFKYFHTYPVYVNFDKEIKSQYLALLSLEHGGMGSGADFSLYSEFVKDPYLEVKSSDCDVEYEYQRNSEDVQKLIFTFQYKYFETTFNITETYELMSDKPYIEKQVEIQCSDEKQKIYFIDMESFLLNEETESSSWTHPIREQDVDSGLTPFVINLGQPVYIKSFFTGCRFPLNDNAIEEHVAHLRYHSGKTFGQLLADSPHQEDQDENTYYCWKTVIGAARSSRLEVVRNDLFSYISEISVPTSFRKQYNSWYDWMLKINESNILESFKEIERGCSQYGVPPLDSYVVDDGWNNYNTDKYGVYDEGTSGTTYNTEGFWVFNTKFPEGLKNPSDFAHRISSRFGVWLGPRGGYVTPGQFGKVIEDAGKGYYNAQAGDIDVGSHRYIENLDKFLSNWISEYKINYFKLDGFASAACTNKTHDHMVGGPNDAYYYTDLWERYIHVFEHFREVASENEIPNFWISITCFVNPSPFHLQWANSVWFQISGDVGYIDIGGNHNYADQMLTYRDSCYYNFSDYLQFQFPAKNLYNHDPIYGKAGTSLEGSMDDEYFRLFLYFCAMRGNAFTEMYYTYSMLDEGEKWYVNSEVLRWTESRFDVLQHSQRFGGEPRLGAVYGYSAWNEKSGTIAIRNPSGEKQDFSITLNRDIGVPEKIGSTFRKVVLSHKTEEDLEEGKETHYNDVIKGTLNPGEARIIDFEEKKDTEPPTIELCRAASKKKVLIRFNKRIIPRKENYNIKDLQIYNVSLKADLRTIILKTEEMEDGEDYEVEMNGVSDQLGNKLNDKRQFTYSKHSLFVFNNTHIDASSGDQVLMDKQFSTDSFSIQLNIDEIQNNKNDDLLLLQGEGNNAFKVEIVNNKVKFTLGELNVVSRENIPTKKNTTIVIVRERNKMLKIYIDGEIANSAYNAELAVDSLTIKSVTLKKAPVTYNSVFVSDYGFKYNETADTSDDDDGGDDDDDDDGKKSKKYIIIGAVVGSIALIAIIVIIVILVIKKKKSSEQSQISFPLISDDKNKYTQA